MEHRHWKKTLLGAMVPALFSGGAVATVLTLRSATAVSSRQEQPQADTATAANPFDAFAGAAVSQPVVTASIEKEQTIDFLRQQGLLNNKARGQSLVSGIQATAPTDFLVNKVMNSLGFCKNMDVTGPNGNTCTAITRSDSQCLISWGGQITSTCGGGDTAPPSFENSTPSISAITSSSFQINADIDEAGTVYYVVVANNSGAPSAAQVKAGQNSSGAAAVKFGSQVVNTGGFTHTFNVTGLTADTDYDVYLVAQDDEGTPNVSNVTVKLDVVTTTTPVALEAGDMVVLGIDSINDTITFATLVDIPSGTVLKITDRGWDQLNGAFTTGLTGDGIVSWTTNSNISAGSLFSLTLGGGDNSPSTSLTNITAGNVNLTSQISLSGYSSNDPLVASGDQVFIYRGDDTAPYFIFGLNASSNTNLDATYWQTTLVSSSLIHSMIPNGVGSLNSLTNGVDALGILTNPSGGTVAQQQFDNVAYTGLITTTDRNGWLARITDKNNWGGDDTGTMKASPGVSSGSQLSISTAVVNAAPVVAASGGTTVFTEGLAVAIDSGLTVTDSDNANLVSATVSITAGLQASQDSLGFAAQNGITGSYNSSTGILTLNGTATVAQYQSALRSVTYSNSSDDANTASRTISFVVSDGSLSNAAVTKTVSVTGVNDAPTLTATGATPTYTENGSAVTLFSAAAVSTVEAAQTISQLVLTVTNLADGNSEVLRADGESIVLQNGTTGTTATNSVGYSVAVSGNTATVTLSGALSTTTTQSIVNTMAYRNTSENPTTAGNRVVTLTSIKDNGGTTNSGVDTTALSIVSSVTVVAVNDAPTLINLSDFDLKQTDANGTVVGTLSTTDVDSVSFTYSFVSGVGDTDNASFSISGNQLIATTPSAIAAGDRFVRIQSSDGTNSISQNFTIRVTDDQGPVITAVSIPDSAHKVGDTVTATITVSSDADNYTTGSGGMSGSINGYPLSSLTRQSATSYTATFTVTDGGTDIAAGNDVPVSLTMTDSSGNTSAAYNTAINQSNDAIFANLPTVSLTASSNSIAENAGSSTLTASLSGSLNNQWPAAITVNLAYTGTATAGTDYSKADSISIGANSSSGTAAVTAIDDSIYDAAADETVIVDMSSVSVGTVDSPSQQNMSIVDDETAPVVTLSVGSSAIPEHAGTSSITATLNHATYQDVVVSLGYSGTATIAVDYNTPSNSITIPAGAVTANATLGIAASDDNDEEGAESILIDIINVSGGSAAENATQQQSVTITDDDDTTAPVISSVSIPNTPMKVGDVVTATITVANDIDTLTLVSGSIAGINLASVSKINDTTYTASFTIAEAGTDFAAGADLPVSLVLKDSANNNSLAFTDGINLNADAIDANRPTISVLTRQAPTSQYTNEDSLTFQVTFTEAVTGVDAADFMVNGTTATISSLTTSDNLNYLLTLTGGDLAALNADVYLRMAAGYSIVDIATNSMTSPAANTYINDSEFFTVDNTAPAAPFDLGLELASDCGISDSDRITNDNTPTVLGKLTDSGYNIAAVELYDANNVSLGATLSHICGAWGITSSTLVDGTHSLTAKATDTAGNVSVTSAPLVVVIDTVVATSAAPDLADGSDTGTANSDNLTTDTTPTFGGSVEPNSKVTVSSSVAGVLGHTTADGNGVWSYTASTALAAGVHHISIVEEDVAGNISAASASLTITIDSTAPQMITSAPASGSTPGAASVIFEVNFDDIVHNISPNDFTLTTVGTAGVVTSVSATSGSSVNVMVSNLTGNGTIRLDHVNSDISDAAGNLLAVYSAGMAHTVDRVAPNLTAVDFSQAAVDMGNQNNLSVTVAFAGTETAALTAHYSISSSGGGTAVTGLGTINATGDSISGLNVSSLPDGTLTISLTLTDEHGNTSAAVTDSIVKDANPPTINAVVIADGDYKAGDTISFNLTFSEALVLSGSNSDYWLEIEIDGTPRRAYLTQHNAAVLTFGYTVQAGENSSGTGITVMANGLMMTDDETIRDAGNNAAVLNFSGVNNSDAQVDTTAPVVTVVTDPAEAVFVNAASYEIKGTHPEIGLTINLYADIGNDGTADGSALANVVVDADGNWSLLQPLTADTGHNFVVVATDAAGNLSPAVDVPTITEDSIAPAVAVISTPSSAIAVNTSTQLISGSHAEDGVSVELFADADNNGVPDNNTVLATGLVGAESSGSWSLTAPLTQDADNNFVIIVKDKAGNVSGAVDVATIIQDAVAPVVTVNTLATADPTPALSGTVDDPTALLSLVVAGNTYVPVNNGNGSWTLVDNQLAALADGVYEVAVSATDTQGNVGTDASSNELTIDLLAPSGYSVAIQQNRIDASNHNALSFVFTAAEVGASYSYVISDGSNSVTGTAQITAANQQVGGINVSTLAEGTLQLSVTLMDSVGNTGAAATATVLKRYNVSPDISGTPMTSVPEDSLYSFTPIATDADSGSTLTFSIANKPSWATFNTATGALTGTPTNADVGVTAGIVISVSDGEFTAALPAFSLTVSNVNDVPVVTGREVTLAEDSSVTLTLSGEDQDGDELSFEIISQPEHGTATLSGDTLVYTPAANYQGTDSLSYVAKDAVAASEPAMISFQVTPVNDAPVAVNDSYTLPRAANHQYALNVLANDSDVDGDTLTIDGAASSVGTVAFNAQGLTLTVPELYVGPVSLSYTLIDGKGRRAKADVSLIIEGGATNNLPVITVPADINTNATALFTRVPLGTATAVDNNGRRLRVSLVNGSLFFAPGAHLVYWQATDAAGNTATKAQKVNVNPLVSLSKDQLVSEGNEVVVDIILNGPAPEYPVQVPYTVTGSADGNDHTLEAGVAEISSGTRTQLRFTVLEDSQVEGNEDIVVTLDTSLNRGSQRSSRIVISDSNIAPVVALAVQQQGENRLTVSADAGEVSINATVTDANSNDLVSGEWNFDKLSNVTSTDSVLRFNPAEQTPGLYEISYTATDNGTPTLSASNRVFVVIRPALPTLTTVDSDGDLIPDEQEGFADSDNDGIPDYLDAISECNVMPTELLGQTEFVAEGDPGVCLRLGTIAATTDAGGLQISKDAVDTDEVAVNIGGIFDFIAYGLPEQGQSYSLVLPQRLPVPANAVYRKYSEMMGWVDFVSNSQNSVASSQGERGYCPPPGDASWSAGLTEGHWCVQVTVQDGGPNDADGIANGAIVDPGGVAVALDGNQLPVATADTASTFGDVAVVVNVLANDSDADGDVLTVSQAVAGFGVVTILADQQLSYLPNADFIGTDVLVYSVTDGKGGTASAELTISVVANTAPVAVNDTASTDDKTAISIAVLANDKDDDGQRLTISTASAEQGSVTISADQKLLYTPKRGFNGVDTIRYSIQDGVGGSASAEVKVTVQAYVDVLINNKSSGGGSLTLWLVLGLAAAVVLRRKPRLLAGAMLLLAPASQATGDWYGQVGVGLSRADVVESRLATQAPAGVLLEFDKKSQSYSLNLGYQWLPRLGLELGYLDLGNAGVNIKSDSLAPAQYHELVKAVSPVLVDGWTLAARWSLWQNDSFRLELPVGMMRWDSSIRSQMGDSVKKTTDQGTDLFYGLQLNYQFAADWQLAVAVQELDLAPNAVSHWQLLLRYQF